MAKPQCRSYGDLERQLVDAQKELSDALEMHEIGHQDDHPNNQSNVDSCKRQVLECKHELDTHVEDCDECQGEG